MLEIALPIQVAIMIGVPLLAGFLLVKRYGVDGVDHLRIFLGGVLSYAVSQALLLGVSQLASLLSLPTPPTAWQPFIAALGYGLGVGVLEELARFGVLRLWLRDVRSWSQGLMIGVGHGGAESVLAGVMALVWFMSMGSLRAGETAGETVTAEEQAQLNELVSAYWSQPWTDAILVALQQVFLLGLALGLATLVMRAFLTGKIAYLPAAMGLHVAATTTLVFLGQYALAYSTAAAAGFCVIGILIARSFAPQAAAVAPVRAPAAPPKPGPQRKRSRK